MVSYVPDRSTKLGRSWASALHSRHRVPVRMQWSQVRHMPLPAHQHSPDLHTVPDSSFPAAIAYSLATGIPFMEGLTKNRYIGRTFIQPDNRLRQRVRHVTSSCCAISDPAALPMLTHPPLSQGVKIKFNPLPQNLAGKSVVLIDDSIVRGNTLGPIIKLLRDVGAKEVHVRISSPPVKHPCFMGIDMYASTVIAHFCIE